MGNRSKGGSRREKERQAEELAPKAAEFDASIKKLQHEITLQQRSGPLPDPQTLAEYDQVSPGAADRIIAGFEQQTQHRHQLEDRALDAQIESDRNAWKERGNGQRCAVTVAIGGFVASSTCAAFGQPWPASIIGGGTLVAMVSAFLSTRSRDQSTTPELDSKRGELNKRG